MLDGELLEKDTLFHIPTLSFDHPLTLMEKNQLKDIIFYVLSLKQIYFKDGTDVKTVEFIRYLLEASTHLDDEKIEKYIFDPNIATKLLDCNFENPDTWQVVYRGSDQRNRLFSISDYRVLSLYFDTICKEIKEKDLSVMEKLVLVYDIVKKYYYSDDEHKSYLEIIKKKEASLMEFNYLFKEFLDRLDIPSYVGKVATKNGISYITMAHIIDSKYDIDGYYLFDPSSDTLPRGKYKSELVRRLNYNFFALRILDIDRLLTGDFLKDILGVFSLGDFELAKERFNILCEKFSKKELQLFFDTFGSDFENLYHEMRESNEIGVEVISEVISTVYKEDELQDDEFSFWELFEKNYSIREKELFAPSNLMEEENLLFLNAV